jgi:hypothetical protein
MLVCISASAQHSYLPAVGTSWWLNFELRGCRGGLGMTSNRHRVGSILVLHHTISTVKSDGSTPTRRVATARHFQSARNRSVLAQQQVPRQ